VPSERPPWPAEGLTRIPHWIYTDAGLHDEELALIFEGPSWCYVGLEAEVPAPGDFKTTRIGRREVVLSRDRHGALHVVELIRPGVRPIGLHEAVIEVEDDVAGLG